MTSWFAHAAEPKGLYFIMYLGGLIVGFGYDVLRCHHRSAKVKGLYL